MRYPRTKATRIPRDPRPRWTRVSSRGLLLAAASIGLVIPLMGLAGGAEANESGLPVERMGEALEPRTVYFESLLELAEASAGPAAAEDLSRADSRMLRPRRHAVQRYAVWRVRDGLRWAQPLRVGESELKMQLRAPGPDDSIVGVEFLF